MSHYTEDQLLNIQERLETTGDVSEQECIAYLSEVFDTPIEVLEARLAQIRGEKLLTMETLNG